MLRLILFDICCEHVFMITGRCNTLQRVDGDNDGSMFIKPGAHTWFLEFAFVFDFGMHVCPLQSYK